MTAEVLREKQSEIDSMVKTCAEKAFSGSAMDRNSPIYDGIADEEAYLQSPLKVAWVLKEPYDDFTKANKPAGGGWSLVKDAFYKSDAWKNPVWQKVAYVMYGFRHGLNWDELPWIRENHEVINEIKSVAWINVSKMPGYKVSSDRAISNAYSVWKDVIRFQLETYNPDVIIFGKTFHCFRDSYGNPEPQVLNDNVWYYNIAGKHLLDTYHPGRKGGEYVNALIDALTSIRDGKLH